MATCEFKNNARSTVADSPLAVGATTLNVATGEGANFPSLFPFKLTIFDDSSYPDAGLEIVKCTGGTNDALTIVRAQEGTADSEHANGERVAMLITAGHFNDATTGIVTKLDTIETSAKDDQVASEVANTPAGTIAATDVQAAINELDTEKAPLESPAFTGEVGMSSASPKLTLHNTEHEDTDYGRESELIFKGEQSGGEETTLGKIQVAHDGVADDQKGIMSFKVNDGTDGDAPTTAMTILANGNVGIGTAEPGAKLTVVGPSQGVGSWAIFTFDTDTGTNDVGVKIGAVAGAGSAGYSFIQSKHTDVANDGNLVLNPAGGNIGIGTTNPQNKLDIEGGLAVGAAYSGTYTAPSNGAIIEGNVGIGTDSPTGKLEVVGGLTVDSVNIGTAVAANTSKNSYPSADATKLGTIEENAKDDQIASEVTNTPAGNIAATDVQAAINELDTEKESTATSHAARHVTGGGDVIANAIAAGNSGLMSGADKTKLDNLSKSATVVVGKSGAVDYLTTDYGSDDACIQAAYDYVKGLGSKGKVLIREGVYTISAKLEFDTTNVDVFGVGYGTVLTPDANHYGMEITAGKSHFGNFKILGDNIVGKGIYINGGGTGLNGISMRNIWIGDIPNTAFDAFKFFDSFLYNVNVDNCGSASSACVQFRGDATGATNNNKWYGGIIGGVQGHALYLNGNSELSSNVRRNIFVGLQVHGDVPNVAGMDGIRIDGGAFDNSFIGCNINGHGGWGLRSIAGKRNSLIECTSQSHTSGEFFIDGNSADNVIRGCRFKNPTHSGSYAFDSALGDGTRYIDNTIGVTGLNMDFINLGDRDIVSNNAFNNSTGTPVRCNGANIIIVNNNFKNTGGTYAINNASRANNLITGNQFGSTSINLIGSVCIVKDNLGFNPVGNFTAPSVPATTVNYTNAYGYPCQVQVYDGTVSEIDIDDIATGLTAGVFMIPPSGTINITYSAAPSWRWWGL